MKLAEMHSIPRLHRVEISGWDMDELFFVEKAEISWDESSEDMRVKLSRPLRKGTVIFLRRLQVAMMERACPLAYSVEPLMADESGVCQYRLTQVHSRTRPFPLAQAKGIH